MRSDEEIERLLDDWLETEAQPIPHEVLESILEAVPRVPQDSRRHVRPFRFGSRPLGLLTAAAVLILVVVAGGLAVERFGPAVSGSHGPPSGFSGNWTSLDCATFWKERPDGTHLVDCELWGDGSTQTLQIGRGDRPRVTFGDSDSSSCANGDSRSSPWVGAGTGEYKVVFLFAVLKDAACGGLRAGFTVERQLYHDSGSDSLWEDEDGDGFGYIWRRGK